MATLIAISDFLESYTIGYTLDDLIFYALLLWIGYQIRDIKDFLLSSLGLGSSKNKRVTKTKTKTKTKSSKSKKRK